MGSNELNYQAKQRQTHRWRADDSSGGGEGRRWGIAQKKKDSTAMDNSAVIAGVGTRGIDGNGKETQQEERFVCTGELLIFPTIHCDLPPPYYSPDQY